MATADEEAGTGSEAIDEAAAAENPKMELYVEIKKAGPCKKHVHVRVARAEIDRFYQDTVKEQTSSVAIPGFRPGHVPTKLVEKRFRTELAEKVKQRILIESMQQLSENEELDPINEPDLDVEAIELPEEGDFEYEFDVEVRPEFELPNYDGLTIQRPVPKITDADVDRHIENFLSQYGRTRPARRIGRSRRRGERVDPFRARRREAAGGVGGLVAGASRAAVHRRRAQRF